MLPRVQWGGRRCGCGGGGSYSRGQCGVRWQDDQPTEPDLQE